MEKRDYYEVLGVSKSATADEIKKAYRKAAIKFHPDKNPGDKQSEESFKEAAEAYDILSNPDKKSRYDQFGHAGTSGGFGGGAGGFSGGGFNMEDIFDRFGDIFGGHFSGFGGFNGGGGQRQRVNKGSDLRVKVRLNLKEVCEGVDKKLKINKLISCDKCGGSGAKDSSSYSTCSTCGGSGHVTQVVNTFFGRTQTTAACPTCGGSGKIITAKCDKCHGDGAVKAEEVVEIRIPKGVAEGMQLSVAGKGNAAKNGGINGDLLVVIEEEQHPELLRDGNDIIYNLRLSIIDAVLGASIEVPAVDGKIKIKVEAGSQPGRVLRLRGKGVPDINGYGSGDFLIVLDLYVPKSISKEERKVFEGLQSSKNFSPEKGKKEPNIFERMHSYFR